MNTQKSNKEDVSRLIMYLGWAVAVLVMLASAIVFIGILSSNHSDCEQAEQSSTPKSYVQTAVPADSLAKETVTEAVEVDECLAKIDSLQSALNEANAKIEQYKQYVHSLINN